MERQHLTASTPMTIAIIGGGFSGTMVATHLLQQVTFPLNIKLIERRPEVGRGIAYSTPVESHLLNVPAAKMSAFPDEPDHFLRWLQYYAEQTQSARIYGAEATSFVPRQVYGDYIQSVFQEAVVNAAPMVHLERVTAEVMDVKPSGTGAVIVLHTGDCFYADQVVLALGNFASNLPAPLRSISHCGHPNLESQPYVREAWSNGATHNLLPDAPVLLVGTGLTMADLVVTLRQNGHQGQIYAISRHGLLPQSHKPISPYFPFLDRETAPNTTRALLQRVRQEVEAAAITGHDWRSVIDALRPISQLLWQSLPLPEQRRFLRHVKSYWEVHRHRIAPEIASVLNESMQSDQLIYYAGRIQACQDLSDRVAVTFRHRGTDRYTVLHVQRIINCTGTNGNYRHLQHPLIVSLRTQQLIQPETLIGIDTNSTGAVIDTKGNVSNWLYTIGTARQGTLWETTAVPELRVQAQTLAETLMRSIIGEKKQQSLYCPRGDRSQLPEVISQFNLSHPQRMKATAANQRYEMIDSQQESKIREHQVNENQRLDIQTIEAANWFIYSGMYI